MLLASRSSYIPRINVTGSSSQKDQVTVLSHLITFQYLQFHVFTDFFFCHVTPPFHHKNAGAQVFWVKLLRLIGAVWIFRGIAKMKSTPAHRLPRPLQKNILFWATAGSTGSWIVLTEDCAPACRNGVSWLRSDWKISWKKLRKLILENKYHPKKEKWIEPASSERRCPLALNWQGRKHGLLVLRYRETEWQS